LSFLVIIFKFPSFHDKIHQAELQLDLAEINRKLLNLHLLVSSQVGLSFF
jgi:hypothetical protein